jgi:hypothetical protein
VDGNCLHCVWHRHDRFLTADDSNGSE